MSIDSMRSFVSPLGGLIGRVDRLIPPPGEPHFTSVSALLGDLNRPLPLVKDATGGLTTAGTGIDGAGGDVDPEVAETRALGEAFERYCSCTYSHEQFIWATAAELGDEALDLDTLPACSATELDHPKCPVTVPDKNAPIRWVRGVSLHDGSRVWIPAILVYIHIPYMSAGERFTLPISTGCAVHTTYEEALLAGLCEVIERDAISVVWLQKMQIPKIVIDEADEHLQKFIDRDRSGPIVTHLFDATSDVGIPTVYSVGITPHNPKVTTLVMCATDMDPSRAVAKVLREAATSRIAMQMPREIPDDLDDFHNVFHGATYMGHPDRLPAFDFLLENERERPLSRMPSLDTGDTGENLRVALSRLRDLNMNAYAVDLTTDEAMRAGLRAVRVIVPELQPLSFSFRAKFLGHGRLYDLPGKLGLPVYSENELNQWPQPFA